jgi:chromosome segregation ATPase
MRRDRMDDLVKRLKDRAATARRVRNEFFAGTPPLDGDLEALCEKAAARIAELEAERDNALNNLDSVQHDVTVLERRAGEFKARADRLSAMLKEAEEFARKVAAGWEARDSAHALLARLEAREEVSP